MKLAASGRTLRWLLLGSFVLTVGAAAVMWAAARSQVPGSIAWALAGALLALAATGWLVLRHAAAEMTAKNAEIVEFEARLASKRARIEGYARAQGRFVGNIAHELKTPLTLVLSQIDLLTTSCTDPAAVRRYAKSIAGDMRHLSDLVDSFLRLARPFAQADTRHHVPIFFHDVVVEAVHRSQPLAYDHGVSIVTTLAETSNGDAGLEVMGDAVLLGAMVENLARNAVRFSPRGAKVEVIVETRGESIVLQVRDHGTGIAAENLTSVFDWFFDAATHKRQTTGTGFGLAIVKRVAEHHGGTITLRNRTEGGCEFEITLPRWRAGESPWLHEDAPVAAVGPA